MIDWLLKLIPHRVPTVDGVPVLLPGHIHTEFGDPVFHYHIDYRFDPREQLQSKVVMSESPVVYHWMLRVRRSVTIRMAAPNVLEHLTKKHDSLICGKCPHRGLTPNKLGKYRQCPGHGLIFDERGKVVKEFNVEIEGLGNPTPYTSHSEPHTVDITGDGNVTEAMVTTLDGVPVCRVPLDQHIPVQTGDIIRITFGRKQA